MMLLLALDRRDIEVIFVVYSVVVPNQPFSVPSQVLTSPSSIPYSSFALKRPNHLSNQSPPSTMPVLHSPHHHLTMSTKPHSKPKNKSTFNMHSIRKCSLTNTTSADDDQLILRHIGFLLLFKYPVLSIQDKFQLCHTTIFTQQQITPQFARRNTQNLKKSQLKNCQTTKQRNKNKKTKETEEKKNCFLVRHFCVMNMISVRGQYDDNRRIHYTQ